MGTRLFVRSTPLHFWDVLISEDGGAWSVIDELHRDPARPPIIMFRHGTVLLNLARNTPPRSFQSLLTALASTRDYIRFARPLSRYIDLFVVPSLRIAQSVVREGRVADGRVRVVPIGVDLQTFTPAKDHRAARVALGLAADVATLLWVGRDIPGKNIELAIRTIAKLLAKGRPYQLVLVADKARPATRAAVRGLLERWTGSVSLLENPDVQQLLQIYAAADLELFPSSLAEGTPLVIFEALASGIPVLCRSMPALLELPALEGHSDWFVETPSIQTWADRVEKLTAEPQLAQGKREARRLAERHCDQRLTEQGTVAAIREAIRLHRPGDR